MASVPEELSKVESATPESISLFLNQGKRGWSVKVTTGFSKQRLEEMIKVALEAALKLDTGSKNYGR